MPDLLDRLKTALADRYTIEYELGAGGMATVYLAEDLKHHRKVAVKVLRPELAAVLGGERFLREIEIVARLHHPHILALYDSGQTGGFLHYVMPYVEGESLRDRLSREKQLALDDAIRITCEVADALSYAHSHDVVHRDIKPENILLDSGHAVVADFGIARALTAAGGEQLTGTGLAIGTPAYMSPEQAGGEPSVDGRSDIYSLACVLYEMLAGDPPFTGPTAQAIMARHLLGSAPRLGIIRRTVSTSVDEAIKRAMAKVPADRFATAAEFVAALTTGGAVQTGARAPAECGSEPPPNSIAVLPFVNLSADSENEYLSDGISEELIYGLAKVGGLHVVARTSAFAFKGKPEDVRTIGQRLNVSVVLEGSVRKAGHRIRVTARLVNVTDGYELWSEHYDRQLDDIFAIEDDISCAIIEVLKFRLLGEPGPAAATPRTGDAEAYLHYLKGRYQWNKRTESGVKKGIDWFERAIKHDAHCAPAYAGLADSYAILGIYGAMAPKVSMTKAKAAALKALEIDDTLAEAYTSLACVKAVYEWDWEGAERDFQHAIKNGPSSPTSRHWYAINLLTPLGRFNEALEQIKHAQKLDPLSLVINTTVGLQYYFAGQYDGAIEEFLETLEMDAKFGMAHFFLGQAYEQQSRYQEAISAFQEAISLSDRSAETVAGLAHAHAISGTHAKAEALLQELLERGERSYVSPTLIAQIHIGLGDQKSTLEWLERAYEIRAADLIWLKVRPVFHDVRGTPRFAALLEKVGHERVSDDRREAT